MYVTRDGGHAFIGDLADLTNSTTMTDSSRKKGPGGEVDALITYTSGTLMEKSSEDLSETILPAIVSQEKLNSSRY